METKIETVNVISRFHPCSSIYSYFLTRESKIVDYPVLTYRALGRRHRFPVENVAVAVHLFLLVFLDDLENPVIDLFRGSRDRHGISRIPRTDGRVADTRDDSL